MNLLKMIKDFFFRPKSPNDPVVQVSVSPSTINTMQEAVQSLMNLKNNVKPKPKLNGPAFTFTCNGTHQPFQYFENLLEYLFSLNFVKLLTSKTNVTITDHTKLTPCSSVEIKSDSVVLNFVSGKQKTFNNHSHGDLILVLQYAFCTENLKIPQLDFIESKLV